MKASVLRAYTALLPRNPKWRSAFLALAVTFTACEDAELAPASTVRDSAGVRVVESFSPSWSEADAWEVAEGPHLAFGVADGTDQAFVFSAIAGVGRLTDEGFFVANAGTGEVRFFDRLGAHVSTAGGRGSGPREFVLMARVGVADADTVFVYDAGQRRVAFVAPYGDVARSVTFSPDQEGNLTSVAWTAASRFVGSVHSWSDVWSTSDDLSLGTLSYLIFDESGSEIRTIARAPGSEARLLPLSDTYTTYQTPLFAYRPAGVADGETLYFGMSRHLEVGVLRLEGALEQVWVDRSFNPSLTEADANAARAALEGRGLSNAAIAASEVPIATRKPPYSRMVVDAEGFLWVAEFAERDADARHWTVFNPEGQVLGQVTVPEGFRIFQVNVSEVIGRHRNPLGVETVWALRLDRRSTP